MSHYSAAFKPKALAAWADNAAASLAKLYVGTETCPIFVYRGMSGVSTATALALAVARLSRPFTHGMMYVRKENECSHGGPVEYDWVHYATSPNMSPLFMFVDDFIRSGNTLWDCAIAFQKCRRQPVELSLDTLVAVSGGQADQPAPVTLESIMRGDCSMSRAILAEMNRDLAKKWSEYEALKTLKSESP